MINLVKSQPPPASLAARKSWRGEDVHIRLQADFHNKCYICENEGIISINVEHFIPHRGNTDLMYDWNNLFFVCGHCNNTKVSKAGYDGILNCTNSQHKVTDWIRYGYDESDFPKLKVVIEGIVSREGVLPTVELLSDVYNGIDTPNKKLQSGNLRRLLQKDLADFNKALYEYYLNGNISEEERQIINQSIISNLQKHSAFSAFKIWIIRSKQTYMADFGQHIPA